MAGFLDFSTSPTLNGLKSGWERVSGPGAVGAVDKVFYYPARLTGNVASVGNLSHSSVVRGMMDGLKGEAAGGGLREGFGHFMTNTPRVGANKAIGALKSARAGMGKFALGAGIAVGGLALLNALSSRGKSVPSMAEMKANEEAKSMDAGQVLTADAMMQQAAGPQMEMPQYPEATLPNMPNSADEIPGMPAMPNEPESFEHRNRVLAERGQQIPGQEAQPEFVAPKSSIAEELMQPRPASAVDAVNQQKDSGVSAHLSA